jgi:hypothetical protein
MLSLLIWPNVITLMGFNVNYRLFRKNYFIGLTLDCRAEVDSVDINFLQKVDFYESNRLCKGSNPISEHKKYLQKHNTKTCIMSVGQVILKEFCGSLS